MQPLVFVTQNAGKFQEVERWIQLLAPEIKLEQAPIDLIEIQSLELHEVAGAKVQQAWQLLHRPLLIDDGAIYFDAYNKFPGTLAKYVYQGIGLDGLWKLAQEDPRATFVSCLVFKSTPEKHEFFEGACSGTLIEPDPASIPHASLPYTKMFIPQG